jgi:hypothetical protein
MVCCGLPACHGVGHHAALSIRLEDLDFSVTLSLESHRHLRTSIIDSIVGEFSAALLTCSFVIRFSAISKIVHLQPHPAETTVVKRFQFLPVFFLQSPAFTPPECCVDNNRLIEPAPDVYYRDRFVAAHLLVHGAE